MKKLKIKLIKCLIKNLIKKKPTRKNLSILEEEQKFHQIQNLNKKTFKPTKIQIKKIKENKPQKRKNI